MEINNNIGALEQIAFAYDLNYEIVRCIYKKSKNYIEFYEKLEEELDN